MSVGEVLQDAAAVLDAGGHAHELDRDLDRDALRERDVLEIQMEDVPHHRVPLNFPDQRLAVGGRGPRDVQIDDDVRARGALQQRVHFLRAHDERDGSLAASVIDGGNASGGAELLGDALADAGPLLAVQTRDGHWGAPG
jgi:hypothetical protein